MCFANGNKFSGEYSNNLRNGYGEFYYANTGESYVGYWKDDLREGKGEYRFKDGSIFRGMFKANVQHGVGKKVCRKMVYTGNWKNGKKHGVFKFRQMSTRKITLVKFVEDKRMMVMKPHEQVHSKKGKKQKEMDAEISEEKVVRSGNKNVRSKINNFLDETPLNKMVSDMASNQINHDKIGISIKNELCMEGQDRVDQLKENKPKDFAYLSVIGEVSEKKSATITEDSHPKFLFTFDHLSIASNQNSNFNTSIERFHANLGRLQKKKKFISVNSADKKNVNKLRVLSDIQLSERQKFLKGKMEGASRNGFQKGNLNKCTSIDLELEKFKGS
jgi:hypothetical protein